MKKFPIDKSKLKAVLLFVVNQLEEADLHKVFKILYFADEEHLARFGESITGDEYIAMKFGPVPSFTYDIFKAVRSDGYFYEELKDFYAAFEIKDTQIKTNQVPDLDELSSSTINCLIKSILENQDLSFNKLTQKSHDLAWEKADTNNCINIFSMAEAGGANEIMLQYIAEQKEIQNLGLI